MPSKPSYALCYGFVSGPAHGRLMDRSLKKAGFVKTSVKTADIIIAHSAGCWLIPPDANPKLVVYVGMPLATDEPRKTWQAAQTRHKPRNLRRHYLRTAHIYYMLRQPRRNRAIAKMAATAQPQLFPGVPAVFIANRHDPWPEHASLEILLQEQPWSFISMPGGHNNVWREPAPYVAIMQYYARLLA